MATSATRQSAATVKAPKQSIDSLTAQVSNVRIDPAAADATAQVVLKDLLLDPVKSAGTSAAPLAAAPDDEKHDAIPVHEPLATYILNQVERHGGEHVIHVGRELDGSSLSFSDEEMDRAVGNVMIAADQASCTAKLLHRSDKVAHIMLRKSDLDITNLVELRIACAGNVDAGKSSTLGVLTKGGLDDGRGRARVSLFRHKHEIESGRTSSVGMEIMGFTATGDPVNNTSSATKPDEAIRKMTWEEVCERSAKVISFIDLAGHERYLKTSVFGLTGYLPDYVMLMVGGNAGMIGMSKEHLGIALALAVPVLVCVTKVDMTPPHILEATIKQLTKILRSPGCRKTPVFIDSMDSVVDTALRLGSERICPIFQISNLTGQNLPLLRAFLNVLPASGGDASNFDPSAPFEFQISDTFSVPFQGTVVSGVILSGIVRAGDTLLLGPDSIGGFITTTVRSIQRKRVNVGSAMAGQSASFALKRVRRSQVRKGMVMLARDGPAPRAHLEFEAEILCLYHSTTLSIGSCMVLHAASIRQTVRIIAISHIDETGLVTSTETASTESARIGLSQDDHKPVVRTGDRARLRLRFLRFAEYVKPGMKLITREGKTKLIGVIRSVGSAGDASLSASESSTVPLTSGAAGYAVNGNSLASAPNAKAVNPAAPHGSGSASGPPQRPAISA